MKKESVSVYQISTSGNVLIVIIWILAIEVIAAAIATLACTLCGTCSNSLRFSELLSLLILSKFRLSCTKNINLLSSSFVILLIGYLVQTSKASELLQIIVLSMFNLRPNIPYTELSIILDIFLTTVSAASFLRL